MFISAQIFELVGLLFIFISMQFPKREELLFFKLISTCFITLGYFFIGSQAGILISAVSIARGILALSTVKHESKKYKRVSIIILCALTILLNIVFWKNYLNILGMAISFVSIYGFFQTKTLYIRLISILTSILEILLNIIVINPMNIIIELFTISSCILGIVKNDFLYFEVQKFKKNMKKRVF